MNRLEHYRAIRSLREIAESLGVAELLIPSWVEQQGQLCLDCIENKRIWSSVVESESVKPDAPRPRWFRSSASPALSASLPSASPLRTPRQHSDFMFVAGSYVGTFIVGSMFVSACGPGCCFVLYSALAVVSGLLMLRRSFATRIVCLVALLLSLVGMWHEKEARDSWTVHHLRKQLERQSEQKPTIEDAE